MRKILKSLRKRTKNVFKKISGLGKMLNWLYFVIIGIIFVGIIILVISQYVIDSWRQNIIIGLGTGIVTSALVTLNIEWINCHIAKKKLLKYRSILFNPIFKVVKSLYIHTTININEYRIRRDMKGYIFMPFQEKDELSKFIMDLREIDIEICEVEKKKNIEELIQIPYPYCKELITLYQGILFDSLLIENIITKEEYDRLKSFSIIEACKKNLSIVNKLDVTEQDKYLAKVNLLGNILMLINKIIEIFDFIRVQLEYERSWIYSHLDDVYRSEIYECSEEYNELQMEKMEYYAEQPEEDHIEESEEDVLSRNINEAIWACDSEKIKKYFSDINKNNKEIQNLLTWSLAKDIMQDRSLRNLYFEKYGIKYKVKKEKTKLKR